MISTDIRLYDYLTFGEKDAYGQPQLSETPAGQIKMAIYTSSQSVQDNIKYKDCAYIGLTHANVDDTFVIIYGNERLKVQTVLSTKKYKVVYLKNI